MIKSKSSKISIKILSFVLAIFMLVSGLPLTSGVISVEASEESLLTATINVVDTIGAPIKNAKVSVYSDVDKTDEIISKKTDETGILELELEEMDVYYYTISAEDMISKEGIFTKTDAKADVEMSYSAECRTCKGTSQIECELCKGTGELIETVTCANCTDGVISVTCSQCNGVDSELCSICEGNGTIDELCIDCAGTGQVESKIVCSECNGNKVVICSECGGTKSVEAYTDFDFKFETNPSIVYRSTNNLYPVTVTDSTGNITYTSSDEKIVAVDEKGNLVAKGRAGQKATITATIGYDKEKGFAPKVATCTVTITKKDDFISEFDIANDLVYNGLVQELVKPKENADIDTESLEIITKDVNGNEVEAVNAGTYTVIVSDNNHNSVTTNVEIAKAVVKVIPDNQEKIIGETLDSHPLTYTVEGEQNYVKVILEGALSYENADKEENVKDKFPIIQGTLDFTSDEVNNNYSLEFDSSKELSIIDFETNVVATVKDIDIANYGYWFNLDYITDNSNVTIEAPEGYLISTKPNRFIGSDWQSAIMISEDGKYDNYRYYLREIKTGKVAGTVNELTVSFGIDTVCPKSDYVKFNVKNDNLLASIGRTLTFGTFFNKKIVADVTSSDELSSVDKVELIFDDGVNEHEFTNEEGKFILSPSAEPITGQAFVTITDKAGNKNFNNSGNELVIKDEKKSNILNNDCFIMIENESPKFSDITVTPIDTNRQSEYDYNNNSVYSGDVEFSFEASDNDSGLYYSEIKLINEKSETVKDFSVGPYTEKKPTDKYIVSTEGVEANSDGSYVLMVTSADAAGNTATTTKTVYVDRHAPIVKSFDITGTTGTADDVNVPHNVKMTDYGFYFKDEANVTVTFVDCYESNELLSGVSKAKIYLVDINGTIYRVNQDGTMTDLDENGNKITGINQIKEIDIDAKKDDENNNSVGICTFTVDKNFKGQIYAMAIDNAGNTLVNVANGSTPTKATEIIGEEISFDTNGYQKPNGSIIENGTMHNNSYNIEINAPQTKKTDYKGTPLYNDSKNQGVDVDLVVEDTYSGIKSIEVDVNAPYNTDENFNHTVTVGEDAKLENALVYNEEADRELDWKIVDIEENIATKMTNTINITNDSNDIVITVTLTDRAGNVSVNDYKFSLDKSAPEIEVSYNNNVKNTVSGKDYYQNERVATVTIRELNIVNSSQIVVTATRDGQDIAPSQYEFEELIKNTYDAKNIKKYHKTNGENGKQTEYYEFVFELPGTVQGDYNITVASTDNAGNKDNYNRTDVFSVDTATPYITVVFDNEDAKNGNYYSSDRKATITVTDRYFNSDTSSVVVTAVDNGDAFENKDVPIHSNWSKQNEKYEQTCEVVFSKDGTYSFTVDSTDLSGKAATQYKVSDFVIDQTKPTIEIKINDKKMNNGSKEGYIDDVVPQVIVEDTNFNQTETKVTLTPVNIKEGANLGYESTLISKNAEFENGMTYDYNNFKGEDGNQRIYDNIYILEASTIDKAGNTTEAQKVTFSVNRYGSTYNYKLNQYYIEKPVIQIEETNVNPLDFDNEETYVTVTNTSGITKTLSSKDINIQTQEATEQNWYSYLYAIPSNTFETDDVYSVKLSSIDSKGRVSTNLNDANKQEISFTVDTTNPYFEVSNYIESENINASSKDLTIDIMDDTSGVASYEITFDGEPVETYETKVYENKTTYSLKVYGATSLSDASGRKLEVKITDAAGRSNASENDKSTFNVRISSSFFVNMLAKLQDFYHMTVAFWCTVAGVIAVFAIVIWIILAKKRKSKNNEEV